MELLKKYFDTALESPDGVKKLRQLILSLAMQGKLVKQDPNDQPANELLKEIQAEKERLIAEGKIKKQTELPPIKPEEIPYEVPKGWVWTRLADCSQNIHYGYTASADFQKTKIRLLRITDIQDNKVEWETVPGCDIKADEVNKYLLKQNDILIARTGGTVGKTYLVDDLTVKAVFASYLIRVIPSSLINIYFLKNNLESPFYWKQLYEKCSGTGQPNVNGVSLSTLLIPLPPLAEQKRIVAKIDQLMALCNTLEQQRAERNQKRRAVHVSALHHLLNASDKREFDNSWRFIRSHFDELYSVKENVVELKKAILSLAMQGKLVKQDPNDQPASELLKEIQAERERLVAEGKIKKQKELPPIKPEEIPYEVPKGWVWARLLQIGQILGGGTPSMAKKEYWNGDILWVSPKDMKVEEIYNSDMKITQRGFENSSAYIIPVDSIIVVGRSGILKRKLPVAINRVKCTLNQDMKALVPYRIGYSKYYQKMFLGMEPMILKNFVKYGMTVHSLKYEEFAYMPIPLPPLAEQKRIVAKIDQLMALCDSLERQICDAMAKQTALLNAVVEKAKITHTKIYAMK